MATTLGPTTTPAADRPAGDAEPDGADTSSRLLAAAVEVFAEKGYDKAGVAEIARRAGLTTGAIYSQFAGKAELLAEAIRRCAPEELDILFAEHSFDDRPDDLLRTVGVHLVTRPQGTHEAVLLEAFVASRRDPELKAVMSEQFFARRQRLAQLIDAGQEAGIVDPDLDPEAIVHFAHAVGLGFLLYEALGVPNPDPAAWDQVIAKVVHALDPIEEKSND